MKSRSQDLEPRFHDAGQFYWFDIGYFLKTKRIFTENSGAYIIDEMQALCLSEKRFFLMADLDLMGNYQTYALIYQNFWERLQFPEQ